MNPLPEPFLRWLESYSALNLILWAAALWAMLKLTLSTIKRTIPAVKNLIALSESLEKLPDWMESADERLDKIQPVLEQVRHEVLPNNGGSLRDDVVTISMQVEKLQAHQDKDFDRLNGLEDTVNRRLERRDGTRTGPIDLPNPEEDSDV